MPASLDKFQILGLLPKQESFQRASATARDTKRQREQAHTLNAMLFHHPFNRHFQPVTAFLPLRRKRSGLKLTNSISIADITILTRKGGGGRGSAALRRRPCRSSVQINIESR